MTKSTNLEQTQNVFDTTFDATFNVHEDVNVGTTFPLRMDDVVATHQVEADSGRRVEIEAAALKRHIVRQRQELKEHRKGVKEGLKQIIEPESSFGIRVSKPPAAGLISVLPYFFYKKTVERVFMQGIADMREEYFEALAANRFGLARAIALGRT